MKDVRIGLLGCGTVGTQVARLLEEQSQDLAARSGARLKVVAIAVRDLEAPRDPAIDRGLLTDDPHRVISQADIVIELIGGVEPARSLILEAFRTGASVVTGNKALLAAHGPELYQAAAAAGIVNGTTNYILDEMTTKGMDFGEALAKAQELGYAEADPSADVDGLDAAAKCAILASLAFHTRVALDDVHVHGIRHITADDVATAARSGCVVKLIASAKRRPDGIELHVGPTLVPATHPLASVHGPFNAIVIEAEAADRLMFYGRGAGGAPTASAVLSDVVAAASHRVDGGHAPRELVYADLRVLAPQEGRSRFQVEFTVLDEVGVLTRVTSAFASHGVSIRSVVQGVGEGGLARLTATTHEACQADLEATLAELSSAPFVAEVHHVNRVEES